MSAPRARSRLTEGMGARVRPVRHHRQRGRTRLDRNADDDSSIGPEELGRRAQGVLLGRLARPQEIAFAVAWLAGDEAAMMTGQVRQPEWWIVDRRDLAWYLTCANNAFQHYASIDCTQALRLGGRGGSEFSVASPFQRAGRHSAPILTNSPAQSLRRGPPQLEFPIDLLASSMQPSTVMWEIM